jgi:transcription initiation factor IIE alpha subunit
MSETISPKKDSKSPDKWEIEQWARTVTEGETIKSDPAKMKHVAPLIKKQQEALAKVSISLDEMRAKGADMALDHKESCPECGEGMDDMDADEMKEHAASHKKSKK